MYTLRPVNILLHPLKLENVAENRKHHRYLMTNRDPILKILVSESERNDIS